MILPRTWKQAIGRQFLDQRRPAFYQAGGLLSQAPSSFALLLTLTRKMVVQHGEDRRGGASRGKEAPSQGKEMEVESRTPV
jgi:hypothetical protein